MACLGSGNKMEATELVDSFKDSKLAELHPEYSVVSRKLMSAIVDYDRENYDRATDTLSSIKDSIYMLGGSNAQQDVFKQLHLVCALKSSSSEHKKLLQDLLKEREVFEQNDRFLLEKVDLNK